MICQNCGFDCADTMKFCPRCGQELKNDAPAEPSAPQTPPEPEAPPAQEAASAPQTPPEPKAPSVPETPHAPQNPPPPQWNQPYQQPRQPYGQQYYYQQPAPQYSQPPQGQQYAYRPAVDPMTADAVRRSLKEIGGSAVVLIAAILLSLSVILGIMGQATNSAYAGLEDFFNEYDVEIPSELFGAYSSSTPFVAVINAIPNILEIVGIFLVFAAAKSRSDPGLGTGGLTLINVMNAIRLGAVILSALLVVIILIMGSAALSFIGGSTSIVGGGDIVYAVLAVAVIVLIIVFAVVISYYICLISAVGAMKKAARTGAPETKGSIMFVAVINFILGTFALIGSFLTMNVFGIIADICSGGALIMFGVALVTYRGRMRSIKTAPPTGGTYGQPQLTVCPHCGCSYISTLPSCPKCGMPNGYNR